MPKHEKQPPGTMGSELFTVALQALLRPVIRFCLRHSVKLQQFLEVSKAVFVEMAEKEVSAEDDELSISRLAVMTGVHRKDVARLLSAGMKEVPANDVFTRVVGSWCSMPGFSRQGAPRVLKIGGGSGEFCELVRGVSKELNPYTILFELERLGMVRRDGDSVQLLVREYAPRRDSAAGFAILSSDLDDIISAAESNIFEDEAVPHLHLTTRYDNVCPELLPAIRTWFMREGAKLHKRARRRLSRCDKDLNPRLKNRAGGGRVAIGTFSLVEIPSDTEMEAD